jgi:hypothetical protein
VTLGNIYQRKLKDLQIVSNLSEDLYSNSSKACLMPRLPYLVTEVHGMLIARMNGGGFTCSALMSDKLGSMCI